MGPIGEVLVGGEEKEVEMVKEVLGNGEEMGVQGFDGGEGW